MKTRAALWNAVCATLLLASMIAAAATNAGETPAVRISPLHFRPRTDKAGDAIAFYWQGQHHVYYLHDSKWDH
ncbi:MAG: hypothetical protein NTW28_20915, partial [Candidatus Solibacter sp.]|nr:hypothetical protein [Candidatus Solibacter sp.]